jgi:NAD(P)-dependent dehydrogenase (short-subunit alcohol dehydrogenase family)
VIFAELLERPVAVVCGSDSLIGSALVDRLSRDGWAVLTIDDADTPVHMAASYRSEGKLADSRVWEAVSQRIQDSGMEPRVFIHTPSSAVDTAPVLDLSKLEWSKIFDQNLRSAFLGCKHIMPLLAKDEGAVVLVGSVLAGWDNRVDTGAFDASQAGLLALTRSLALAGGQPGIRVNAVCTGAIAETQEALPEEVRGRIPLGRAAEPADVIEAIRFLLSADARHIDGSEWVVDGGQSLQSWSNAPRDSHYPLTGRPSNATPDQRRFADRIVLITGAAGGLGAAAARRFASEGAWLALLDRDGPQVSRLADDLRAEGVEALPIEVDVTDEAAMAAAIAHAEEHFGKIDVLFNNAGIGSRDLSVMDMPAADWDEVIAINLRGVYLGCKFGVPALVRAGGGAIVNMGSSTGRHDTITGSAAYMASKAAVEALTKSLALQVAPQGIRANTICPGIIQTELSFRQQERGDARAFFAEFASRIPFGRVGQPEDVAAAVAFLASDRARHITGASLLIDGGQTLRRWISAPTPGFGWEGPR